MPIVINLYGGPGSGKSTGAAYIFSMLKANGINAELVPEFAKDKVWEENKAVFENQAYIFGKQYFRLTRCADKVDVIITDSPLLLSTIYNHNAVLGEDFNNVVRNVAKSFDTRNYFIKRVKKYNPVGRHQSETEASVISYSIWNMLRAEGIPYTAVEGNIDGYNKIVEDILKELKNGN